MQTLKTKLAITVAACVMATCLEANAALTVSASIGGAPLAGSSLFNFDSLPVNGVNGAPNATGGLAGPGLSVSFITDGGAVAGAVVNVNAAPFLSGLNGTGFGSPNQALGADGTTYLTSGGVASPASQAILSFAASKTYLGLLWGSVDNYNTLTFYNGATLVGSVTGSAVQASVLANQTIVMANGDQGINGTAYVNITGITFDKVVATSTQYAFEFDNVAVVPEPTTMIAGALLLLPFGASTIRFLRKKA